MQRRWSILFFLILFTLPQIGYSREKVRVVSLEWPPYTGERLPEQGTSIKLIRQAFDAAGLELEITFEPWNRALFSFHSGEFDAVAPVYSSRGKESSCLISKPFQVSPLGFIVLKPNEYKWSKLEDLAEFHIGIVNGYSNTWAFDELVARKVLTVDVANDDRTNILKVAWMRIPLAIMDRNVFQYLMAHDKRLKSAANDVGFNPQILGEQELFLCFQPTQKGARLKALFDEQVTKLFK